MIIFTNFDEGILKKGFTFMDNQDYKRAKNYYFKSLKKDSNSVYLWYYKGLAEYKLWKEFNLNTECDEAVLSFVKATDIDLNTVRDLSLKETSIKDALNYKLNIFTKKGNFVALEPIINTLIKLEPKNSLFWLYRAEVMGATRRFVEARENLKQSLILDPSIHIPPDFTKKLDILEKYSKYYYVPIDYTDSIIYIAPDEDILYSTLAQATQITNKNTVRGMKRITEKYNSHILFTRKAIIFSKSGICMYNAWFKVKPVKVGGLKWPGLEMKFKNDPNYESNEEFKSRIQTFWQDILRLRSL